MEDSVRYGGIVFEIPRWQTRCVVGWESNAKYMVVFEVGGGRGGRWGELKLVVGNPRHPTLCMKH